MKMKKINGVDYIELSKTDNEIKKEILSKSAKYFAESDSSNRQVQPVVSQHFECSWCKDAGLGKDIYTRHLDELGGFDSNTGKPICQECADAAFEEMNAGD